MSNHNLQDEDWEEVQHHLDHENEKDADVLSIASDSEDTLVGTDAGFIHIDHPRSTKYTGRIYQNPEEAPQGPIPTLRRALYALKDTLRDCVERWQFIPTTQFAVDAQRRVEYIFAAQKQLLEGLNMLLTNYASDWERLAQEGGMTFDEFVSLDPEAVRGFTTVIHDFSESLRVSRYASQRPGGDDSSISEGCKLDDAISSLEALGTMLKVSIDFVEEPKDIEDVVNGEQSPQAAELPANHHMTTSLYHDAKADHDKKIHATMMSVSDW